MLASGIAGQVGGALVSPYFEPTTNDAAMLTAVGTWTLYQSVGWGYYGAHLGAADTQAAGYALTSAGTGAVVGIALVPVLEITPAESAMMTSMGAWGTWYGGWGGHLMRLDPASHWLGTLSLGNVGMIGTAAVLAGPYDADWRTVGLVDGMGLLGGAGGALVGVVASPEVDVVATSSLIGSTAGLAGGFYLVSKSPETAAMLDIPDLSVGRVAYAPSVQLAPWTAEDGTMGGYVQLDLREHARSW
jgi:hypothetical protein